MALARRSLLAATAGTALLAACGTKDPLQTSTPAASGSAGGAGTTVTIGGADFSESILLAEIYAAALRAKGVDAKSKTGIGSREIYLKALTDGSVDVVPEYTGALALYYDKTFAVTEPQAVYDGVKKLVPATLTVLNRSAAEDKDSITVTKDTAAKYNLKAVGDLASVATQLVLGAPPEFKTRTQGVDGLKATYGLTFSSFVPLKGQALVQALKNGQVQVANIGSTDPAIITEGFVALADTKLLYGSQNVVPLVRKDKESAVSAALNAVSAALTTEKLTQMLKRTDVDKADAKDVAAEFVKGL